MPPKPPPGPATAGCGTYVRDPDSTWRYRVTGDPVPGAVDVTDHRGRVVTVLALELAPDLLLDTPAAA